MSLHESSGATGRVCGGCGKSLEGTHGKRKWCSQRCARDVLYAGTCSECGAPTDGSGGRSAAPRRCRACSQPDTLAKGLATRRARQTAMREVIQGLWAEGLTREEIGARLGMTSNYVGVAITQARNDGWDIPYRYAACAARRAAA